MENSLKTEREIQLNYINFEQLSPKSDIAESEAELFNKAFSYALKDENVFNIAVTGVLVPVENRHSVTG